MLGKGMPQAPPQTAAGQRGPADHVIRAQIVQAASEHFRHYGYGKTTVSDLARTIGFSKGYIYKFFESKRAIGEVICAECIDEILQAARDALKNSSSATERLRALPRALTAKTLELLFHERKLFDIVMFSVMERWISTQSYKEEIHRMLVAILLEGRASGEFERKTPLDETSRAIFQALQPFIHPIMLECDLEQTSERLAEVTNLILRSLAP